MTRGKCKNMAKYFDSSRNRHIMIYCMSEEFAIKSKGISMRDDICREAKQLIQSVMEGYISGNPEILAGLLTYCSPDVLVIGTGRHEFYLGLEALTEGMRKDQEEADESALSSGRPGMRQSDYGKQLCCLWGIQGPGKGYGREGCHH